MSNVNNDNNIVLKAFESLKIMQILLCQHIWGWGGEVVGLGIDGGFSVFYFYVLKDMILRKYYLCYIFYFIVIVLKSSVSQMIYYSMRRERLDY